MIYFATNENFLKDIQFYDMILFMTPTISHSPIYRSTFENFQNIVNKNNYNGIVVDVLKYPLVFKMYKVTCLPSFINLHNGQFFGDCKV